MAARRRTPRRSPSSRRTKPPVPPRGFRTVTPHLAVDGAAKAVEFYTAAFGARELLRQTTPDGKVLHSRLRIGDSLVMLADVFPGGSMAPSGSSSQPVYLHLYVADVDRVWKRALAAGARSVMPLDDMFWGERYGQLQDPFGHRWSISTPVRMTKRERDEKRAAAMRMFEAGPRSSEPGA